MKPAPALRARAPEGAVQGLLNAAAAGWGAPRAAALRSSSISVFDSSGL
jgi:hypothetical protein